MKTTFTLKTVLKTLTVGLLFGASVLSAAEKSVNLDQLLENLEKGQYQQSKENKQREAQFVKQKNEQEALLKEAVQKRDAQLARSAGLETKYEENEMTRFFKGVIWCFAAGFW